MQRYSSGLLSQHRLRVLKLHAVRDFYSPLQTVKPLAPASAAGRVNAFAERGAVSSAGLARMLKPRKVALVGASSDPDSAGGRVTRAALESSAERNCPVQLLLVNPRHEQLHGRALLKDVRDLPDDVDLAVLLTPWDCVPTIIEGLAARGVPGILALNIATESGWPWDSRASLLNRLKRQLAKHAMRCIGPASQGIVLARAGLNLSLCPSLPSSGGIGFVGASEAVASVVADWAVQHGSGVSTLISLGDELDVSLADVLDFFARDTQTRAVLLYLDALQDAPGFFSALRACAFRKPVAVLKSFGLQVEASHRSLFYSLLTRCGALVVNDLDELCAAANVDLPAWPHAGSRFALAGNGTALTRLGVDAVMRSGGSLARLEPSTLKALRYVLPARSPVANPLDLRRDADAARYAQASSMLLADPNVDVVLLCHHPTSFTASSMIADALTAPTAGETAVLAAFAGAEQGEARLKLAQRGIAAFATPESAVRAYALNRRYYAQKQALTATPPPLVRQPEASQARFARLRAKFRDEDAELMRHMLALPGLSLSVHATASAQDSTLVLLPNSFGISSDANLGRFGYVKSPQGLFLEALPINRRLARQLLGAAATDAAELLLVEMCEWGAQLPQLRHWSLHELHATGQASSAAEAAQTFHADFLWKFALRGSADALTGPSDFRETLITASGQKLLVRDIRAEDETQLQLGFNRLSAEEVRLRFMYPLKSLTHELSAKLSQLDYRREIALVLTDFAPPGASELFAVVRASFDEDASSAEFAIVIPNALSGQGIGKRLLGLIIARVRASGLTELWGNVLAENRAMLNLASKLGFEHHAQPDEPGMVRVSLKL